VYLPAEVDVTRLGQKPQGYSTLPFHYFLPAEAGL
jgi:hypothetical protein